MFASVANMKNLFFENPDDANIKEIGEIFYLRDAIIPIDASDIKEMLEGADNAIVLHGKATGHNRCADAIYIHALWQKIMTFFLQATS